MSVDNEKEQLIQNDPNELKLPDVDTNKKPAPKSKLVNAKDEHPDEKQLKNFLGPMFDDLEKAMAENMKQLDKLEEDLLGDSKIKKYEFLISHLPVAIRERKSTDAIIQNLETLIVEASGKAAEENEREKKKIHEFMQAKLGKHASVNGHGKEASANDSASDEVKSLHESHALESKLSEINSLACLSQSISAYLITANSRKSGDQLKNLTIKLYDAVNLWISRLFRFHDSSIIFHEQEYEGLIRMCNMMINYKCENYQKSGYKCILKQPIIYISESSKYSQPELKEIIAIQLGLPVSSLRTVKVSKSIDNTFDKIDLVELNSQIERDIQDNHVPILCVANAGSYAVGQCDDIKQLNEICYKHRMWVHLEGFYLSSLAMYSVPTALQPVFSGDSITLNLPIWLGVPSLTCVTLYKNVEKSNIYIQPFNSFLSTFQRCLPYWCVLQALGHEGVIERIRHAYDMGAVVKELIEKHKPYLKILDFKYTQKAETKVERFNVSELFSRALDLITFVDLNNPIIILKCDQKYIYERMFFSDSHRDKSNEAKTVKDSFLKMMKEDVTWDRKTQKLEAEKKAQQEELNKAIYSDEIVEYTDTLTTWLGDLLNSLNTNIEFELIEIENEGVCIRYSPLDHVNITGATQSDLNSLTEYLDDLIPILDASIKCKSKFVKELQEFRNLVSVNVPKWAGVGAVRYIPEYLIDKKQQIEQYINLKLEYEANKASLNDEQPTQSTEVDKKPLDDNKVVEAKPTDDNSQPIANEKSEESKPESKPDETHASTASSTSHFETNDEIESYIDEINNLNKELVRKLQSQDGAFSLGEADDGLFAVKFGMVKEIEAIKKLAIEVKSVGKEVEESSIFLKKMNEIVRKGIEKANEDLKKEQQKILNQESLIRHIPLVGGLFNWIAPAEPVNPLGRTFSLQSGKIATTEVIYKYHMQVEQKEDDGLEDRLDISKDLINAAKSKPDLIESHQHERRSSTSSFQSNSSNAATTGDDSSTPVK